MQDELLEKKTTKEKVHTVLHCLDDVRCMRLQEDLSPKTPRPALSLRPSNITSSGHEREPVSTSMELEGKEDEEHEYNGDEADEDDTIIAHSPQTPVHSPQRSLPTRNTELQVQARKASRQWKWPLPTQRPTSFCHSHS